MKNHGVKLKNAQKEVEKLREAWTEKDVQLAAANSSASQQRHVGLLLLVALSTSQFAPSLQAGVGTLLPNTSRPQTCIHTVWFILSPLW